MLRITSPSPAAGHAPTMAPMSIRSLADFLEQLDAAGQLRRVSVEVSAVQEVAELTRRVAQDDGPALVFQKLAGATLPLVTNLLGTERRIAKALGADGLSEIAPRMPGSAQGSPHGGWLNWLKAGLQGGPEALAPRAVRTAACQQVVRLGRDVDLAELPSMTLSPHDHQPSLYGACVVSGGIEPGENSLAQFDLPILDGNRLAIRWGPLDTIGRQFEKYRAAGQKMPIAVLLGAAPVLTVAAAAAPREPALNPYLLAGVLGGEATDVVACRTIALQVPAEADIVIEGMIDPAAPVLTDVSPGYCGGFGLLPSDAHDIQVTALTQRSNPLATATIPHSPPNEASALVRAVARLWLPATLRVIPGLVDLDMPDSTRAGQITVLSIRKQFPGQARQVAAAWWGQPATATTKFVIVVDADVSVSDLTAVWSEVATQADPARDLFFFDGPIDHRDFSSPMVGFGSRLGIDATTKLPVEQDRGWPARSSVSEETRSKVDALWDGLK